MISFETRFNEATGKWQWRHPGKSWSPEVPLGGLLPLLRKQVENTPIPVNSARFAERWGKPLDHRVKSPKGSGSTSGDWEIRGGKVQRIPATQTERRKQELEDLASILDLDL